MTDPTGAEPTTPAVPPTPAAPKPGHWLQYVTLGLATLALVLAGLPYLGLGGAVRTSLLRQPEIIPEAQVALRQKETDQHRIRINERAAASPAMLNATPGDAVIGPANAKVTVVEFYDFRCPGCKATAPGILQMVEAHPDVRFIFKDWPILDRGDPSGPSHLAAYAAAAAQAEGKFLPVFRDLMAEPDLNDETISAILTRHGMDPAAARRLAGSPDMARRLAEAETAGLSLTLIGTPTFFVNGQMTSTIEPREVDQAIAAAKAE